MPGTSPPSCCVHSLATDDDVKAVRFVRSPPDTLTTFEVTINPNTTVCAVLALSGHSIYVAFDIAFGGKADMTVCGNPLSRSLLGVKRTCRFALQMSAFDPKRT
jgi:hypothetical protein